MRRPEKPLPHFEPEPESQLERQLLDMTAKLRAEAPEPDPEFTRQFEQDETIEERGYYSFDVKDCTPPEILENSVPVIVSNAYMAGPESVRSLMESLYREKRRSIAFDSPTGMDVDIPEIHTEATIHNPQKRIALAAQKTIEQKGLSKVDAVGYSQGCINIIIAALMNPEKFRSIVLVQPGGLMEGDTMEEFLKRHREYNTEIHSMVDKKYRRLDHLQDAITEAKEVGSDMPFTSAYMGLAIGATDIHAALRELKAKGVSITVIASTDDKLFPAEKMSKSVTTEMVDGLYVLPGLHTELNISQEVYNHFVNRALEAQQNLQLKRQAKENPKPEDNEDLELAA